MTGMEMHYSPALVTLSCLIAAGMDDYLAKPLNTQELKAVLCKWLDLSDKELQQVSISN